MEIIKRIVAISIASTGLFASGLTLASEPIIDNNGDQYIKRIIIRDNGMHAVLMHSPLKNSNGCDLSDRFLFDENAAGGKAMLATILSASLSEIQIHARTGDCAETFAFGGTVTAPVADIIRLTFSDPSALVPE